MFWADNLTCFTGPLLWTDLYLFVQHAFIWNSAIIWVPDFIWESTVWLFSKVEKVKLCVVTVSLSEEVLGHLKASMHVCFTVLQIVCCWVSLKQGSNTNITLSFPVVGEQHSPQDKTKMEMVRVRKVSMLLSRCSADSLSTSLHQLHTMRLFISFSVFKQCCFPSHKETASALISVLFYDFWLFVSLWRLVHVLWTVR